MTDQSHQCVIIGIAGASASGKSLIASTLYRELREQVGDEHIGVIPEDCYYKIKAICRWKNALRPTTTIPARWITACCLSIYKR